LRFAFWIADGVWGRKQELDHFFGQHGIDICLLTENHLRSGVVFRMANYFCHRTDQLTQGGGTAILARRCIDHHAVPVQGLRHLEETAIQVMMGSKPVRILAVYLSPCRPLLATDLSACIGGGLPVLMAGDLNAEHVEWNSRIVTRRVRLLRDYADKNSCLIYGPNTPTTVLYNFSAAPDVLDIIITKDVTTPVHLTTCSALNSDHLPILIDTGFRSSFLNLPDRTDVRKTDWSKFQACLEIRLPSKPDLNEESIDGCVKDLITAISKALADSTPKRRPAPDPRPSIPAPVQDEIRLKNRLRRKCQITRGPALKAEVNRLQRSVTNQLNE
jgi:endonuclease/exonuclease/phosphatase family metal-dependent hydrolase